MNVNLIETSSIWRNRILAFLHRIINGVDLDDPFTGLRLVRFELLQRWKLKSLGFDVEAEYEIIKS